MTTIHHPSTDIDIYSDAVLSEPYDAYAELRSLGPVVWMRPHVEAEACSVVDRLVAAGSFDAATELAQHLPMTVVSQLVGGTPRRSRIPTGSMSGAPTQATTSRSVRARTPVRAVRWPGWRFAPSSRRSCRAASGSRCSANADDSTTSSTGSRAAS